MTIPINAQIHRDGKWFIAFSPEFPEANGQGETKEESVQNLKAAIDLLLKDRRESALGGDPSDQEMKEIYTAIRKRRQKARQSCSST